MDLQSQKEFKLLSEIERGGDVTQRTLAKKIGLALGLTNLYLKRLARKGYIKIKTSVLEAMACGCPVICSDASSLPEVAGHAAILVSPSDVPGFTAAMTRVLTDSTLAQSLRERGLEQAAGFSWDRK